VPRLSQPCQPDPRRLTSLETGTALEVYDLLAASTLPFYVTCVDVDVDNLLINSNRAKELGCADRITFLQGDVPGITRGQASISLGQQQCDLRPGPL